MIRIRRTLPHLITQTLALALFLLVACSTALAQSRGSKVIHEIEFKPGQKTAMVEGTVGPPAGEGDMHDPGNERYTLTVRANRKLSMLLTSDEDQAVFSFLTPDDELVKDAARVKEWTGRLRKSGRYHINVFTTKGHANFKLKVTLQ